MDEILHRFGTMGSHCLLERRIVIPGFLRCRILPIFSPEICQAGLLTYTAYVLYRCGFSTFAQALGSHEPDLHSCLSSTCMLRLRHRDGDDLYIRGALVRTHLVCLLQHNTACQELLCL